MDPRPPDPKEAAAQRAALRQRLREDAELERARAGAERWMDRLSGGEGSLRWPAVATAGFVAAVAGTAWMFLDAGSLRLALGGLAAVMTLVYAGVALSIPFVGRGPVRLDLVGVALVAVAGMLAAGGGALYVAWLALSRRCDGLATHRLFRRERLRD